MSTKKFTLNEILLTSFKGASRADEKGNESIMIPSGAVFPNSLKVEKFKSILLSDVTKKLYDGDILFNTGGVGTLGRVGFFTGFDTNINNYYTDSFVLTLRFDLKKVLPKYVYYYLQTPKIKSLIVQKTTGTTGITSIKNKDILDIVIPIPVDESGAIDLNQQILFVDLLDKTESLRKKKKDIQNKINVLTSCVFHKIIGDTSKLPTRPLGGFCNIITGNTPPRINKDYYGSFLEWIKTDNLLEDELFPEKSSEYLSKIGADVGRTVEKNSILMNCIAGSVRTIGNISLTDRKVSFNQQINAIVIKDDTNPLFLYWYFKIHKKNIQKLANSVLKYIINKTRLESFEVPIIPKESQDIFAKLASEIEELKNKQKKTDRELDRIFNILLSRIFNI